MKSKTTNVNQQTNKPKYYSMFAGGRIEYDSIPPNTYSLSGINDENERGNLYVRTLGALIPLMCCDTDKIANKIEFHGKTFDGTVWYKQ